MTTGNDSSIWIPVEEYGEDVGIAPSELVSMILDGDLTGARLGDRWYVARPLVVLECPNNVDDVGWLTISACCLGSYVTAGRGKLGIPLRFEDPGRAAALIALEEAMETRPSLPIEIHLNGQRFLVDSSLWVDLSAALVEYQAQADPSSEM